MGGGGGVWQLRADALNTFMERLGTAKGGALLFNCDKY